MSYLIKLNNVNKPSLQNIISIFAHGIYAYAHIIKKE